MGFVWFLVGFYSVSTLYRSYSAEEMWTCKLDIEHEFYIIKTTKRHVSMIMNLWSLSVDFHDMPTALSPTTLPSTALSPTALSHVRHPG